MTRREIIIILAAGVITGLLMFALRPTLSTPDDQLESAATDIDQVRTVMLTSHTRWQNIQGEVVFASFDREGNAQRYRSTIIIVQPNKALYTLQEADKGALLYTWISDGANTYLVDHQHGDAVTTEVIPAYVNDLSLLPTTLDSISSQAVYPHPFSMIMPVPFIYELFPVGLAQRSGKYELLYEMEWNGRKTWQVRFSGEVAGAYELLTVDQQTGIILASAIYSPDDKSGANELMEFTSFVVDGSVNEEKFHAP